MMYNYPVWGFPSFRRNYYSNSSFYKYSNYKPNRNNYNKNIYNSLNNNISDTHYSNNSNNCFNKNLNNFNDNNSNQSSSNSNNFSSFFSGLQNNTEKIDFSCNDNYYSDNEYFNIFGLNLHIDDLLILALIFFLYKEGIDDMYLYITLFLLLLG